jgi:hypothetical protein
MPQPVYAPPPQPAYAAPQTPQPAYPPPAPPQPQTAYAAPPPPQPGYAPQAPPAYPPQAPPQTYAAPPVPAAKPKKKRGCLIAALVVVIVLLLSCAGAAWGLSSLFKPKDLGVSYTEADYQSAVTKLGIVVEDTAPNLPVAQTKIVYKGKKKVNVKLTSAEVSAAISMHHRSPKWALADVQILLGDNNQFQMSGYAVYQGQRYGFNADLTAVLAGAQSVGGSAQNIVVFGVDFPKEYYAPATLYLVGAANDWLGGMGEGLDIQAASIQNGELVLVGTVPASAQRVPLDGIVTTSTPTP